MAQLLFMKITSQTNYLNVAETRNLSNSLAPKAYDPSRSSITFGSPALQDSFFEMICQILWAPFAFLLRLLGFGTANADQIQKLADEKGFFYFYNHHNPISEWLGNFYPCSVTVKGMKFSCSEAAFQMHKFEGNPRLQQKFAGLNGDRAFHLARDHANEVRSDLESVREGIMLEVLEAKFQQNPHLQTLLLATGKAYLVEHNEVLGRDKFWSDNHNGTGQNRLGILLMVLRKKFGGHGIVSAPNAYKAFLQR